MSNENSPLEEFMASPPQSWIERGVVIEESWLVNPVTGERVPVRRAHAVMADPRTGSVAVRDVEFPVQCIVGDVITNAEALAFCSECGWASCPRHSVCDPFCGRTLCIQCSRLIEVGGLTLRICGACYKEIRAGWFKRMFRRLMGRD